MLGDPTVNLPTLLKIFVFGTLAVLLIVFFGTRSLERICGEPQTAFED